MLQSAPLVTVLKAPTVALALEHEHVTTNLSPLTGGLLGFHVGACLAHGHPLIVSFVTGAYAAFGVSPPVLNERASDRVTWLTWNVLGNTRRYCNRDLCLAGFTVLADGMEFRKGTPATLLNVPTAQRQPVNLDRTPRETAPS